MGELDEVAGKWTKVTGEREHPSEVLSISRKLDFPGTKDRGLKPLQLDRSGKGDVREVKT